MKFAIILLIIIGVYSIGLVAFNEFYPSYTQNMYQRVVSIPDINQKFDKYLVEKNLTTDSEVASAQMEFIKETFYKDIAGWSDTKYIIINDVLLLFDQFKSSHYRFLLLILTLSLTICVIHNSKPMYEYVFSVPARSADNLKKNEKSIKFKVTTDNPSGYFKEKLKGYKLKISENDGQIVCAANKNGIARVGAWFTHIGMVSLFIGGLIISLNGIRFHDEAWQHDPVLIKQQNKMKYKIDFDILVRDYEVTYTDNKLLFDKEGYNFQGYGHKRVKDYVSLLEVFDKNGNHVLDKYIEVNDPLEYEGFMFYQSNSKEMGERYFAQYGEKFFDEAVFSITIGDKTYKQLAEYQAKTDIVGTDYYLIPESFDCTFEQIYRNDKKYMRNQEVVVSLYDKSDNLRGKFKTYLSPDKKTEVLYSDGTIDNIDLMELEPYHTTGIEIATSPGQEFVWFGFIISTLGLFMSFFISHKQVWALFIPTKKDKEYDVFLRCRSNSGLYTFENEIKDTFNISK